MQVVTIRQSRGLDEITPVRHVRYLVLREPLGLPYEETLFAGDENPDTLHIVAYRKSQPVGCLTLMHPEPTQNPEPWVQLRGMAVLHELQGQGIGSQLLAFVANLASKHHWKLWCKARESAVAFYSANGWKVVSDRFDIPNIGPHDRMEWNGEVNL
ncbi:MAG: GNAT family N-acetyltransferase [Pirellula sp.]